MVLLVMFQDSIDYQEYEFGERKESVISAWRPLDVKLGSALLRGFQYLIFLTAGVMPIVKGISDSEGYLQAGAKPVKLEDGTTIYEAFGEAEMKASIKDLMSGVSSKSLIIIGIWITIILIACFVAVFLLIRLGYKITEESHRKMVDELEKRHAASGFDKEELAEEQA